MPVQAEKYKLAAYMSDFGLAKWKLGDRIGAIVYLSHADDVFRVSENRDKELENLMRLFRAHTMYGRDLLRSRVATLIRETGRTEYRREFLLMSYGLDRIIDWFTRKNR